VKKAGPPKGRKGGQGTILKSSWQKGRCKGGGKTCTSQEGYARSTEKTVGLGVEISNIGGSHKEAEWQGRHGRNKVGRNKIKAKSPFQFEGDRKSLGQTPAFKEMRHRRPLSDYRDKLKRRRGV